MLRWLTAGESHGPELVAILEGMPAGVAVSADAIAADLHRRTLGYGRGARQKFEQDALTISAGVIHGLTIGSPIALRIGNTEWPKWQTVMASGPVPADQLTGARAAALTRPRPGHADLVGMEKYGFTSSRPVLERASARETAARVALGALARALLEPLGIELVSHTVALGGVHVPPGAALPVAADVAALDADPLRCHDPATSARMVEAVDAAHDDGETLGGVVEVLAYGLPAGLGSYAQADRRLDGRLAAALMSIQAIKGVELGDGFGLADVPGSQAHDEMVPGARGIRRLSNHAGGTEGGMSNGEPLRIRAAMKPIATVPRSLRTVDTVTGEPAKANHQRSDVCAVPAAGVVAEAMVALVLANAVLEKFGGDSLAEIERNLHGWLSAVPEHLRTEETSWLSF